MSSQEILQELASIKATQSEILRLIRKPITNAVLGSHGAAKLARVRQQDLLRALDKGELAGEKIPRGNSYSWRIQSTDVIAWAKGRR